MEFQDQPKTNTASIRERLDFCVGVLNPAKDDAYEKLAALDSVSRAVHELSIRLVHLVRMAQHKRGFDPEVLFSPGGELPKKPKIESLGPRPSEQFKAHMEIQEEGPDLATGEWRATAGAVELTESRNLDITALVASGELKANEDGIINRVNVRNYLREKYS